MTDNKQATFYGTKLHPGQVPLGPPDKYGFTTYVEPETEKMTLSEAEATLVVPADKANNNCVQDAQWRLRDVLKLAYRERQPTDEAPSYVVERVNNLKSWLK